MKSLTAQTSFIYKIAISEPRYFQKRTQIQSEFVFSAIQIFNRNIAFNFRIFLVDKKMIIVSCLEYQYQLCTSLLLKILSQTVTVP